MGRSVHQLSQSNQTSSGPPFVGNQIRGDAGNDGIMPRATDDNENRQPTISEQQWNARGYLFGAAVPHPTEVVN